MADEDRRCTSLQEGSHPEQCKDHIPGTVALSSQLHFLFSSDLSTFIARPTTLPSSTLSPRYRFGVSILPSSASPLSGTSANMHVCATLQAPRAPLAGFSPGGPPRPRATPAARRLTVATAHPASRDDENCCRRNALIAGLSGVALLAAPQCAHLSCFDPSFSNMECPDSPV